MIVIRTVRLRTLSGYVGRPLAVLFAFDVAIAAAYVFAGWTWLALPDIPLSILGGVIGVLAGFRHSSACARWWEARTIWGAIVNNSRSFAREVLSMIVLPEAGEAMERELSETKRKLIPPMPRLYVAFIRLFISTYACSCRWEWWRAFSC
jgi:putative membrane protein